MKYLFFISIFIFLNTQFIICKNQDKNLNITTQIYNRELTNYLTTNLSLIDQKIEVISFLSNFTNLVKLKLCNNKIKDISVLTNLKNLKYLDIGKNLIKDISALKYLTSLEVVYLYNNKITNIDALQDLRNLKEIDLRGVPANVDTFRYWQFTDELAIYDMGGGYNILKSEEKGIYQLVNGFVKKISFK